MGPGAHCWAQHTAPRVCGCARCVSVCPLRLLASLSGSQLQRHRERQSIQNGPGLLRLLTVALAEQHTGGGAAATAQRSVASAAAASFAYSPPAWCRP